MISDCGEENIGFAAIANALLQKGIASIRMDFPGCGESTESFQKNTLTNMKQDVLAAIAFVKAGYPVDDIGLFGYSMGGRIALELLAEEETNDVDADAVVLLAPAADNDDLKNLFGGAGNYAKLNAEADANGFVVFTTIYGQTQELSKEWFADLAKYADIKADAAKEYDDPALVIWAVDDAAVSPAVSAAVAAALKAQIVNTPEDGHSYGFYSDKTAVLNTVVNATADFFAKELAD